MKNLHLLLFLLWSTQVFSQNVEKPAVMTAQTGGRYEIVQSQRSSVYTFKLDKHVGRVFIFVQVPEQPMPNWVELPKSYTAMDTVVPDKINYQLFLGGNDVDYCFLLNIHTGATWMLKQKSNRKFSFEYFDTLPGERN